MKLLLLLLLLLIYPCLISFENYRGGGSMCQGWRFRVLKTENGGQSMREPPESYYSAIFLQTSVL